MRYGFKLLKLGLNEILMPLDTEIMIDIETLSTAPDASIATIGAIKFSRDVGVTEDGIQEDDKLYFRVDKKSCQDLGMTEDPNTIEWWESQHEESRAEVFEEKNRTNIEEALKELAVFVGSCRYVWSNSPNFDIVILENAYRKCGLRPPWKFWNLRDCRTVYDLGGVSLREMNEADGMETSHTALGDCFDQILCLQLAFTNLGLYGQHDSDSEVPPAV